MRRYIPVLIGAALFSARAADVSTSTLHQTMQQVVAPQAQIVWSVGNAAFDDDGKLDGGKITNSGWNDVAAAARQLKAAAQMLAQADGVPVAATGEKLQYEGNPDAADAKAVQRYIDANKPAFRRRARALQRAAGELIQASAKHDVTIFSRVSESLDEVCEECHERFWYPETKKK